MNVCDRRRKVDNPHQLDDKWLVPEKEIRNENVFFCNEKSKSNKRRKKNPMSKSRTHRFP